MNLLSVPALVFSISIFFAIVLLFRGWENAFRKDVKFILAGLLILLFAQGITRFLEWSGLLFQGLDPYADLIATVAPILWVFFFYAFIQQVSDQRKEQLNSLLRAVRNVNKLLVKEDDKEELIEGVCKDLIEARGYEHVWIALFDDSKELVAMAQQGLGDEFDELIEQFRDHQLPTCAEDPLEESEDITIEEPSTECRDCPLSSTYGKNGALNIRLEYGGRVYGIMSASVPKHLLEDEEELGLIEEVAGDIAFALYEIEVEKDLEQSEKRFRSYVENAPVGVYVVDEGGNYVEANEAACEMTGYSKKELLDMDITDLPPEKALDEARGAFERLLADGEMEAELPYIRKDETKGHMVINAVKLSEDRYLGFTLDITKRKRAQERLRQATLDTLQALNRTIEAKDEYTGDHIDRVQSLSIELGKKLGLIGDHLKQLRYAAILHDIGKIGVPDSILGKPGDLTEEEWEEIEKHPKIGERIVSQVDQLQRAAEIIGQHQEKYDGTGYPKGLKGKEITLEARIIAVADAWDAMRTDRPYREALPREKAIKELKDNAGTQFDPEIVDILLDLIEEEEIEQV